MINQLAMNIKRIHGTGVRKVAVTTMEPLGCLPAITASTSYQNCSETENLITKFHNKMLIKTVRKVNKESGNAAFGIIDLHRAFLSALKIQGNHTGRILKGKTKIPFRCEKGVIFFLNNGSTVKSFLRSQRIQSRLHVGADARAASKSLHNSKYFKTLYVFSSLFQVNFRFFFTWN